MKTLKSSKSLAIIAKLKYQTDGFFPRNDKLSQPTVVFHDDLSKKNILVDESGYLTAVVD